MFKKALIMIIVAIMIISPNISYAKDYDIIDKATGNVNSLMDVLFDMNLFFKIVFNQKDYLVEYKDQVYNLIDVQSKFDADENMTMNEAIIGLSPYIPQDNSLDYTFIDEEDLDYIEYMDILGGDLHIINDEIYLKMKLRDIPYEIPFNKESTPADVREYEWGVVIGTKSLKGYSLSSSYFKHGEYEMLPLEEGVQTDIWEYDNHPLEDYNGASRISGATITVDYFDNTITLTGQIPGISKEEIDYIIVCSDMYDYYGEISNKVLILDKHNGTNVLRVIDIY